MLINTQRDGHLRVAIVKGTQLEDYQVEITESGLCRGNIYRGVIANVQPSLNAAFVDIGEDRHAFLPVADVLAAAYHKKPPEDERRPAVDQVLEKGKPIYVQVTKDGIGQKGSALTTNIALAGRYLVLAPFDGMRGISRKAEDDGERKKARERLAKLELPDGFGVIVRTNGLDQNQTTLNRDLNALLRLWRNIKSEGARGKGPRLLYSDQDLVVQALRDYLDSSIEQVVVDSDEVHEKAESYMQAFMPRSKIKLVRYRERQPLFSRYNIEPQVDGIYERRAHLPGGGSIVIDTTEALTAIDVNSGRATQNVNHDDAIYNVNVEAAAEVARQLRLRDIGGLVVVDFIDMRLRKHQRKLEKEVRDALKADRARTAVGRVSANGLLEINRQRIKQSLKNRTHRPCPTCQGVGSIPNPDFSALNLLGRIEARAATGLMKSVVVLLHPEKADALQNHHRRELAELEQEFDLKIEILSNPSFTHTQERIDWTHRESPLAPAAKREALPAALSATDIALRPDRRKASAPEAEADGEEKAAEERPRRKRRRRSRGRGKAADADSRAADARQADDKPRTEPDRGEAAAEVEEGAQPARRRRSSRGRSKSSADEAAATPEPAAARDEPSSKSRRRRRSPRRRKPSDENGHPEIRAQQASGSKREADEDRPRDGGGSRRHEPDEDRGRHRAGPQEADAAPSRDPSADGAPPSWSEGRRPVWYRKSSLTDSAGADGSTPSPPPRAEPPREAPPRIEAAPPGPPPAPLTAGTRSEKLSSSRPLWRWFRRTLEPDE
jgi:ribonuclease E